ncbi:MAG: galactose-1-phosphate uridylyltransferase [Candidatus Bathyarchaeia archaeon]
MPNEIRRDYILDRWVIIASERAKRPTDFKRTPAQRTATASCPFCPGSEAKTPPATLLYMPSNGGITKTADTAEGPRQEGWLVRSFPNLYPALRPREAVILPSEEFAFRRDAVGAHEVLVESPRHDEHPGAARLPQLRLVVEAYIDKVRELSRWAYVQVFRNHGEEAGASLSHAHSQIIATPMVPRLLVEELEASRAYWEEKGRCPHCLILTLERGGDRFIYENDHFLALSPWAAVYPFEFWILPKRHQSTLLELQAEEKANLTRALRVCLGALAQVLNDPPYSYGLHIAPSAGGYSLYHWHLEVYPKLTLQAGFENSTGMFINVTPPEDAAQSLRATAQDVEQKLNERGES